MAELSGRQRPEFIISTGDNVSLLHLKINFIYWFTFTHFRCILTAWKMFLTRVLKQCLKRSTRTIDCFYLGSFESKK